MNPKILDNPPGLNNYLFILKDCENPHYPQLDQTSLYKYNENEIDKILSGLNFNIIPIETFIHLAKGNEANFETKHILYRSNLIVGDINLFVRCNYFLKNLNDRINFSQVKEFTYGNSLNIAITANSYDDGYFYGLSIYYFT